MIKLRLMNCKRFAEYHKRAQRKFSVLRSLSENGTMHDIFFATPNSHGDLSKKIMNYLRAAF
jgi:hypothetical protein